MNSIHSSAALDVYQFNIQNLHSPILIWQKYFNKDKTRNAIALHLFLLHVL